MCNTVHNLVRFPGMPTFLNRSLHVDIGVPVSSNWPIMFNDGHKIAISSASQFPGMSVCPGSLIRFCLTDLLYYWEIKASSLHLT